MPQRKTWYEVVSGDELQQGDLLVNFPITKPPKNITFSNSGEAILPPLKIECYNVVLLTQSCDLENNKISQVLICPHFSVEEFLRTAPRIVREDKEKRNRFLEQIRRGYQPPLHMLDAYRGSKTTKHGIRVVNFRQISVASFSHVKRFANGSSTRLRLRSPYTEHLSQAFARFFMRVGLPSDINKFSDLI